VRKDIFSIGFPLIYYTVHCKENVFYACCCYLVIRSLTKLSYFFTSNLFPAHIIAYHLEKEHNEHSTYIPFMNIVREATGVIIRDGRCDSPQSSVKLCTYLITDVNSKSIIHTQRVNKCEVGLQSPNMEKEAFQRCLHAVSEFSEIDEIVTVALSSVQNNVCIF